jgi:hypothetical protein
MFKSRTLFVIGAGASKEVSLPIGAELADIIGRRLNYRFQNNEPVDGDREILNAILFQANQQSQPAAREQLHQQIQPAGRGQLIQSHIGAARQISAGIALTRVQTQL